MLKIQAQQKGFSLIEVLISLVIMAVGVLGLTALQLNSLRYQNAAKFRGIASQLAYDISDRIRQNPTGDYTAANASPATCAIPTQCLVNEVASRDLQQWRQLITRGLPSGAGAVTAAAIGANKYMTVTLTWNEQTNLAIAGQQNFTFEFLP